MGRVILKTLLFIALVGAGWAAGLAPSAGPDFEIRIDARRVRREPATVVPNQTFFTYKCGGSGGQRCNSGRVGGWIKR